MDKEITEIGNVIRSHTGEISQAWINKGTITHTFIITAVTVAEKEAEQIIICQIPII